MLETILSMYNFGHLQSIDIDWNTWNIHMASIMTLDEKYLKKNFQGSFNTCRVHNYNLKGTLFPIHKYDILHDLTHQYNVHLIPALYLTSNLSPIYLNFLVSLIFSIGPKVILVVKVHIFWEGHSYCKNRPLTSMT